MKTVAAFTRDIQEVGYGNMRINNYRKDGSVFNVSITVFPIYDSVGIDKEPVLTHFATILEEIRYEKIFKFDCFGRYCPY